jgi:phage/plasmid-like protein (TIGR03299 family)
MARTPREPKRFTSTSDAEQMRRLFGFTVEARPLYTRAENTQDPQHTQGAFAPYYEVPGKVALCRTDTGAALGVASPRYGIIQPLTGYALLEACGDLDLLKAGTIGDGQRMYIQARVKGAGFDVGGQPHEPLLFLGMHNDASGCYFIGLTPTRIQCWNQLRVALGKMLCRFAIRHTGDAQARAEVAAEVIGRARQYFGAFSEQAARLVAQRFAVQDMKSLCEELWPTPKAENLIEGTIATRAKVLSLFTEGKLNAGIHGTRYGALNAVAEYVDHGVNRKGGDAGKANALLFGLQADRMKQIAYDRIALAA